MKISAKTDVGVVRSENQDFCLAGEFSDGVAWAVVCDGMGGVNGGNVASETAANMIFNKITKNYHEGMNNNSIKMLMITAIEAANAVIFARSCEDEALKGMGTTVVLAIIKSDALYIAHVGDSRLYVVTQESLTQITTDHSIVQMMIDNGEISADEAKNHPSKNVITRALGVDSSVKIDFIQEAYRKNDIVLLCTDGLSNYVDENDILAICNETDSYSIADRLVEAANKNGGGDNVTVVTLA